MNSRNVGSMGLVSIALGTLLAITPLANTQEKKHATHADHKESMLACAKACSDCQRACHSCSTHCSQLVAQGHKEHLETMMKCQDCATVCAAAAEIVARGGPFALLICDACSKACEQCAVACEKFPDDKQMKACAEECRRCEKACKEMLKHMSTK